MPGLTAIDLEKPALRDGLGDRSYLPLLWGARGRTSIFRRVLTTEQRLVRNIGRGGYPLLRQDTCPAWHLPLGYDMQAFLEAFFANRPACRPAQLKAAS